MDNGLISVQCLREMDKIAAEMEDDYCLEDLIQAVECQEDFTQPHSFVINSKDERKRDLPMLLKCDGCEKWYPSGVIESNWKYCPVCGLPIIRWEEEN